jgi:hypothetical protein
MTLVKCQGCDVRDGGKPTTNYIAWRRADSVRVSYKATLCVACFASKVAPLDRDYRAVDRLTCPSCGIDTEDDHDDIYITAFVGGYGELRIEAPFCPPCGAQYRIWVVDHGAQLEDRLGATGGPQTKPSGEEVLRALGIEPRDR